MSRIPPFVKSGANGWLISGICRLIICWAVWGYALFDIGAADSAPVSCSSRQRGLRCRYLAEG